MELVTNHMCNTCGCKEAEESMVRKHRPLTKKQRQNIQDAIQDVDYMRDKFEAMEVFPAGTHDIEEARRVLDIQYPGIEITDVIYMTKKSGRSNAFHIFMETNRGGFNVYGRIGYPDPNIYGPMTDRQYRAKITKKAKGGYSKESFSAEGESHDYTPESYDPLTTSPQTYDPMSESYSAEQWKPMPQCEECGAVEGGNIDGCDDCDITYWFNGKVYHPDSMIHIGAESYSAEGGCGCGNSQCMCAERVLFIDKTGEEAIMDEFIDEGEDYHDAKDYARKAMKHMDAEGRKRRYGKRQRFDHIKGNSRYLARDAKGRWISNVGVSGSIKQDLRSNAISKQPVGFRGLGDAKVHHAEGGVLTNATIQWEDGVGTSSPSSPPYGIHFGAEAYTDMYPQNSAEVDGMTGNGVPVAYGSGSSQYVEPPVRMGAEEGFTYMHEDFIPNTYGEDSALSSGRGVPQWYGSAEHQDAGDSMRERNLLATKLKQLMDEKQELANEGYALSGSAGDIVKAEKLLKKMEKLNEAIEPLMEAYEQKLEDAEPEWRLMEFEAMEVFPPSYEGDLENSMRRIRGNNRGAEVKRGTRPVYLTKRQGSMNRFHFFIETNVGNFNVYGRIGYPNPQVYGPMTQGIYADKMRTKIRKGYKKSAETFENPMIDEGYYPNTYGESSAVISGNGVPQWYGSAENIVLEKPIETGAKLGLGFILMSAGVTLASVFTGMLLGE